MSPRSMVWQQLDLIQPLDPEAVESVLAGLCTLSGGPIITLEARGSNKSVSWRIGCDATDVARVRDVLRAHLPALHLPRSSGRATDANIATRLQLSGSARRKFAPKKSEPIARSVLGALARAGKDESVTLQITLGPRRRPRSLRDRGAPDHKFALEKSVEPRFTIDIRVGATANLPDRVRSLINSVIASVRGLEVAGMRVTALQTSVDGFINASLPWFWRSELTPAELTPLTAWPIGDGRSPLPGVPAPHPRRLHASADLPKTGLVLGSALDDPKRPIALSCDDASRHLHLIGPTGVGKSTLTAHLAVQRANRGDGVIVIDGKGDLVRDVLARIPKSRLDDVVLLDPLDESPVGIGGFSGNPDRTADSLLAVFHSLYASSWGVYSSTVLQGTLLTLARRGDASLPMIPMLLNNPGFRRSITSRLVREDPMGLGAFWAWYEALSDSERQQAIGPVMRKLQPILVRPAIRHVIGQHEPRFSLADVFTKKKILLVSLSAGRLGPEASAFLGSVVVALLWDAITVRSTVAPSKRFPVAFFIDDVQEYLRIGEIGSALELARGLGVSLTLSHQHLKQLSPDLREAVFANARSRVMFGLAHQDATEFARMSRGQIEPIDIESLPAFEAYASLLVNAAAAPWVSVKTAPLGPTTIDPELVRARSRANYGVSGRATDEYLQGLIEPPAKPTERFGRAPKSPRGSR